MWLSFLPVCLNILGLFPFLSPKVLVLMILERELLGGGSGEFGGDLSDIGEECGDWCGLAHCWVEEELEVFWRGERVWTGLLAACVSLLCSRGEVEWDLLRGVRRSALRSF